MCGGVVDADGTPVATVYTCDYCEQDFERPDVLVGSTYKIKSPLVEHAMYVTINDIVLNAGTDHEQRRPFEVFINSKSMEHFQWIVALTRIMSAVFRKGGDVAMLLDGLERFAPHVIVVFRPEILPPGAFADLSAARLARVMDRWSVLAEPYRTAARNALAQSQTQAATSLVGVYKALEQTLALYSNVAIAWVVFS